MEAERERFNDEGCPTETSRVQQRMESQVHTTLQKYGYLGEQNVEIETPLLLRTQHHRALVKYLSRLPEPFSKFDASQAWVCYWSLHALALLDEQVDDVTISAIVAFLANCYDTEGGGYGGGPHQYGHLAPTYAAINSLVIIGSPPVWAAVDRQSITEFLLKLRAGDGSFYVQEGGESDMRSVYCAVAVAKILNIDTPDLFENSVEWILRCQTYEGGFGGNPGHEAHGGYAFCAVAALYLLNGLHKCDLRALLRWAVNRQMSYEGGFQGRTNKLVDSCYSFWQGATIALAQYGLKGRNSVDLTNCDWMFDSELLQEYVLVCCQDRVSGGLRDKPQVPPDPYHTCYSLSGLSLIQSPAGDSGARPKNTLEPIHPAFNLPVSALTEAIGYFYKK